MIGHVRKVAISFKKFPAYSKEYKEPPILSNQRQCLKTVKIPTTSHVSLGIKHKMGIIFKFGRSLRIIEIMHLKYFGQCLVNSKS